jgi:peptide methionine sulfoxide reductase msrA/msrB
MKTPTKAVILAVSIFMGWTGWKGAQALFLAGPSAVFTEEQGEKTMTPQVKKSPEEWKKILSPEQYRVMFECGTEPAFSGRYNDFWETGEYACAACRALLFNSETKYEHGTGWPSFSDPAVKDALVFLKDRSFGMPRVEVRCARCGAHLGHVFDDGPAPTGRHYCINSASLVFAPKAAAPRPIETATFAAGCFWGVEDKFSKLPGVTETVVGYTGGRTDNPTYRDVCTDETGHAEAVRVTFDPSRLSYADLVRAFFAFHDPTQKNRQGPDVGTQYRSVIFYHSESQKTTASAVQAEVEASGRLRNRIVTEIVPADEFTKAEGYHQKYYQKKRSST